MSNRDPIRLRQQAPSSDAWASAPVSRRSCFGDDLWQLDIAVAGRCSYENRLNWDVMLADGSRLTDPQHARLLNAARQFLWSMANDPPHGRKRVSPSSLYAKGQNLIVILRWMIAEGYASFAALDGLAVERLSVAPSETGGEYTTSDSTRDYRALPAGAEGPLSPTEQAR